MNPEYEFEFLLRLSHDGLFIELAHTHELLANLHTDVAFLRAQEGRGVKERMPERIEREGTVKALEEKKWLIVRLLERTDAH